MATKTIKKTSIKDKSWNLKVDKTDSKKSATKTLAGLEKSDSSKKVVVKRRKLDLAPTKASAVAIASQANRAKKQALINKVSASKFISNQEIESSDKKIPLWVWVFFWCSLLLFCVSFYQAIIRPQIEKEKINVNDSVYLIDENLWGDLEAQDKWTEISLGDDNSIQIDVEKEQWTMAPKTATDAIVDFFNRLSNRDFDGAFELMVPSLRNYNDIRTHFTSYRMNPFFDWIEWWELNPENFRYVNSPSYWKEVYDFDLSYVLKSNQEKYDEVWEFTVNTQQQDFQISSIRCISRKCSYHPIFWPENFGLMR